MTQYLPPNLLALFAPRDPIPFVPPPDKLPHEKKSLPYSGVAQFLKDFENPKDTPPPTRVETKDERSERKRKERAEQVAYKLEQDLALWDPATDGNATSDPYKTLFVARINYDTSESKMRREFESYGAVRRIHIVTNSNTGKPRGYAFVEFEHERDMHAAYKHADGKKIDGRRVLVDVERSRTVKGWRPRRLGGGLGGTRKGGPDVNTKYSGRDDNIMNRSRSRSRERRPRRSRSRERVDRAERPRHRSRERVVDRRRRSRSREHRRGGSAEPDDGPDRGEDRRRRRRSRSRDHRRRSRSPRRRRRSRDRGDNDEQEKKYNPIKDEPSDPYQYTNFPVAPEDFDYEGADSKMPLKTIKREDQGEGDEAMDTQYDPYTRDNGTTDSQPPTDNFALKQPIKDEPQ